MRQQWELLRWLAVSCHLLFEKDCNWTLCQDPSSGSDSVLLLILFPFSFSRIGVSALRRQWHKVNTVCLWRTTLFKDIFCCCFLMGTCCQETTNVILNTFSTWRICLLPVAQSVVYSHHPKLQNVSSFREAKSPYQLAVQCWNGITQNVMDLGGNFQIRGTCVNGDLIKFWGRFSSSFSTFHKIARQGIC